MTTLGLEGASVESVASDYTVRLGLTGGHFIVIESPFTLHLEGETAELSPEDDPDGTSQLAQQLVGRTVAAATADDAGALLVRFEGGAHLSVPPDSAYEAWNVSGPNGALVVSTPGGKLAVWSAQKGESSS